MVCLLIASVYGNHEMLSNHALIENRARQMLGSPRRQGFSSSTSLPLRTIRAAERWGRLGFDLALRAIRRTLGADVARVRLRPGCLQYCGPYGAKTPSLRS